MPSAPTSTSVPIVPDNSIRSGDDVAFNSPKHSEEASMRKCSEVMTREPACCEPGESIVDVAGTMKAEDVGSVPVVESHEDKKLIGIVTDRDLVVKVLAGGADVQRATVRDAMTANPASCRENDDVSKAVQLMS